MATKVEKLEFEGSQYEVIPPAPTSTERGGIIASAKTDDYTTEVKLGNDGKAYVPAVDLSSVSPYGGRLEGAFNIDADYGLTVGYYWCHITDSTTGVVPVKDYGILEVIRPEGKTSGVTIQRFTTYSNGNNVYTRMYCNAAWSAWRKLAVDGAGWTSNKIFTNKYGGTVNVDVTQYAYAAGRATVQGNVLTKTTPLMTLGIWGSTGISLAHGSSSCNFTINADSVSVSASGDVSSAEFWLLKN